MLYNKVRKWSFVQGKIEPNELKSLAELKECKNPFERIDYKVRTIITVFGKNVNDKYYFNEFYLNITYNETVNDNDWTYTILIKYLGNIVYDSEKRIYESNRWETMLDVIFNVSYKILNSQEKDKELIKKS